MLMEGMPQEEGSSSVTSSPLKFFSTMPLSPGFGSQYPWMRETKSEERGLYLIQLLVACANHVAANSLEHANICLEYISHLSSPDGDTMQRISAYFAEALAERMLKGWPGLHKALNFTKISSMSDEIIVRRLFFELCPFMRLSYVITNQAILEAMEGEKVIHIIDLNCFEPAQWINFLQLLSARPEGPPHLRITGIHEQKEVLEQMVHRLNDEAEKLDIPFQFNPIVSKLENLNFQSLRVKTGEALAVSSVLQLHTLLAFVNDAKSSKMTTFLNSLWGLSPKIMVVTEQESNNNRCSLVDRMHTALNYYAAMFDCLESTFPRVLIERQRVEKMLLGKEIKNIIACEEVERKERHEKLERWIPRIELSGFGKVPLSYHGFLQARKLLQNYGYKGYKISEQNGYFLICWQNQPLYSVSAWRFRRCS